MLTKEHLKFRVRTGRAHPTLVDPRDQAALAAARELTELFEEATRSGMTFGELEEAAEGAAGGPLAAALKKLLLDACDEAEPDETIEERRWQWLAAAEALRREAAATSVSEFQEALATRLERPFGAVREGLYGDLPACRRVAGFKSTTPDALLHRYNLAQVQGLLLRARRMTVKVKEATLLQRRQLFRQLKFQRLLCEVVKGGGDDGALELEVSGPLAIFDQASTYGLRLATFFPHLLHLPRWEVTAEVHINKKELTLKVDEKTGLVSHYRRHDSYLPEELTAFVDAFNKRACGFHAAPGDEFVHLGKQSYCFPDLTITGQHGEKRHVELFHRWHAGQLAGRLGTLEASATAAPLIIGVSKSVAGRSECAEALASSRWFAKNGFLFSEFPTPKAVLSVLERE